MFAVGNTDHLRLFKNPAEHSMLFYVYINDNDIGFISTTDMFQHLPNAVSLYSNLGNKKVINVCSFL